MSRLVDWLVRERSERVSHGLYYNTQIAMGYNSNHMEGSTLTPEQTAQLFTTGSVLADGPDDIIRADDVIEMGNHFRMFDWMLDHVDDPVDKTMVCTMQSILKRGTSQESNPDRNIGGYKILPNVISEIEQIHTVLPADVPAAMNVVYELYRNLTDDPYAIAKAHWMFESTHPLSDGNGRVGRMIMFKELLRIDTVPVVVRDSQKLLYYRGLRNFSGELAIWSIRCCPSAITIGTDSSSNLPPAASSTRMWTPGIGLPSSGVILRSRRITLRQGSLGYR